MRTSEETATQVQGITAKQSVHTFHWKSKQTRHKRKSPKGKSPPVQASSQKDPVVECGYCGGNMAPTERTAVLLMAKPAIVVESRTI